MTPEWKDFFDQTIATHPVTVFMKGTKDFPVCGFSARVVQVMNAIGADFKDVNIMESEELWENLKEYSDWPTSPQIYVGGEFIGGCDITIEMAQSGELQKMVEDALSKAA